jgi:hypothetical protein
MLWPNRCGQRPHEPPGAMLNLACHVVCVRKIGSRCSCPGLQRYATRKKLRPWWQRCSCGLARPAQVRLDAAIAAWIEGVRSEKRASRRRASASGAIAAPTVTVVDIFQRAPIEAKATAVRTRDRLSRGQCRHRRRDLGGTPTAQPASRAGVSFERDLPANVQVLNSEREAQGATLCSGGRLRRRARRGCSASRGSRTRAAMSSRLRQLGHRCAWLWFDATVVRKADCRS